MICGKDGCMAECRVKSEGKEKYNGTEYEKQVYWCVKHGERYSILRREGFEDILEDYH